jgi:hypothetical protein
LLELGRAEWLSAAVLRALEDNGGDKDDGRHG